MPIKRTLAQKPLIFISYRREDSNWATELLFGRLESTFGKELLFRDIDSIHPGDDFRERIEESLEHCAVMLVVIGANWLTAKDAEGNVRIDSPQDWVRIEVEEALERKMTTLPVLLYPVTPLQATNLPNSISKMAYLQAITIYPGKDFQLGFSELVEAIADALPVEMQAEIRARMAESAAPRRTASSPHVWRRVLLLVAIILIVCLAIGFAFIGPRSSNAKRHEERKHAAALYSEQVADWFESRYQQLEATSQLTELRSNESDSHGAALTTLASQAEFPGGAYTLDEQGLILEQATPNYPDMDDLRGMDFSHRDYFIECRRHNKSISTNSFMSANRNELIVVLATPRVDERGSFIGILNGVLDISATPLSGMARAICDQVEETAINIYLIDAKGIILASSKSAEIAKPFHNLSMLERFRDGTLTSRDELSATIVPLRGTTYYIVAEYAVSDS